MPTCEKCGSERASLHKHHKIPRSLGGTNDAANIERLCANCHEDAHRGSYGGPDLQRKNSQTPAANKKRAASMRKAWAEGRFKDRCERTAEQEAYRIEKAREARQRIGAAKEQTRSDKSAATRRASAAKRNASRNKRIRELTEAGFSANAIGQLLDCSAGAVNHTRQLQKKGLIP